MIVVYDDIEDVGGFALERVLDMEFDPFYTTYYLDTLPEVKRLKKGVEERLFVLCVYEESETLRFDLANVLIELPKYNISALVVSAPLVKDYVRDYMDVFGDNKK